MTKTLAFIIFTITSPDSDATVYVKTENPVECIAFGEAAADRFEAAGFIVDYRCRYTRAPVTSIRPIARPVRIEI